MRGVRCPVDPDDRILEDTEKPGEVSIEHEQLPAAMEIHA
jgi:hypothetical protein